MNSKHNTGLGKYIEQMKASLPPVDERLLSERVMLNKLNRFGIKLDKVSLLRAGENVIAVEQVFDVVTKGVPPHIKDSMEFDCVYAYILELWRRWYPDRITFEMLQLRLDSITNLLENDNVSAAAKVWYKTWPLFMQFFDMCKIDSAPEFRSRFPRYDELLDSILIVAEELAESGGLKHLLENRISLYEQLLERLSPESERDDLTDRIRALLADSYMVAGRDEKVDAMFRKFLDRNPTWSYAWLDWYYCYLRQFDPEKNDKAESILREALKVLDGRAEDFDPELHEHKKNILVELVRCLERFERPEDLQLVLERLEDEYPSVELNRDMGSAR